MFYRLWLGELVHRQAEVFGPGSRIVNFHRGFQLYVAGKRKEALWHFERVVESGPHDAYEAIALHLKVMCSSDHDSDTAVKDLRMSIRRASDCILWRIASWPQPP